MSLAVLLRVQFGNQARHARISELAPPGLFFSDGKLGSKPGHFELFIFNGGQHHGKRPAMFPDKHRFALGAVQHFAKVKFGLSRGDILHLFSLFNK